MQDVLELNGFLYLQGPGAGTAGGGGSGGSGSGAGAVLTGAFADPNGNVTPADPTSAAWYYQDGQALVWWQWSIAGQVWYQGSG